MKRLARILGVAGGVAAVLWAMRDRFVSVALPREPEPPTFRTPEAAASDGSARSITDVSGIGPVYATRLADIGVTTIELLSDARPEQVAAAANVPLSRAVGWVDRAKELAHS